MAWKHELSKIKKELKEEPTPAPPEKPKPKPAAPVRPMEDEDAVFLAAMGQRPASTRAAAPKAVAEPSEFEQSMGALKGLKRAGAGPLGEGERGGPTPVASVPAAAAPASVEAPQKDVVPPVEPAEVEDFAQAMFGLRGMKPVAGKRVAENVKAVASSPAPVPAAASPAQIPAPEPEPVEPPKAAESQAPEVPEPHEAATPSRPALMQLAAGMAVEVDGTLDLRGHSVVDARERLEERVQDARFLGWRTLHVHLGPDPELAAMFEAFLDAADVRHLSRHAIAPIPMGGPQARILYLVQA